MNKIIKKSLLIVLFTFPLPSFAQQDNTNINVTFRVISDSLPDNATIHITGNHTELKNWKWPFVPLERQEDKTWERTFSFKQGTKLKYVFNLGTSSIPLTANRNILGHFYLEAINDTVVQIEIPFWQHGGIFLSGHIFDNNPEISLWRMNWKYHPGDPTISGEWADPTYDDNHWEIASPLLSLNSLPEGGRPGVGWFRLHIFVDSTLIQKSFGMIGRHSGNIQIYWDGQLQSESLDFRFPKDMLIGGTGEHVLAVRYATTSDQTHEEGSSAGFFLNLNHFNRTIQTILDQKSNQIFFTALLLAFALLHLILFIFSPAAKSNLVYSILLVVFAAATYVDIQSSFLAKSRLDELFYLRIHRSVVPITAILFLRFVYSIFYQKCPRQFWIFTLFFVAVGILLAFRPQTHYHYFVILGTISHLEVIRVVTSAILKKKDGAWIFAIGLLIFGFFGSYDALLDLEIMQPINQVTNAYYFGFVGLFVASSVYLARDLARTNKKLVEQERQIKEEELTRKLVEADNKRKTKELEEARELQLSMLPHCRNDISGFDLCFHMETATEVGGDYYDYFYSENGTLTIAIGDATGHGMKAGTMVSVIKSLFITHAHESDILPFFDKCTRSIKQMRLKNLYMSMMLAKIKDNKMTISSAGMPPAFIYRSGSKSVEEVVIKSMPLGGPSSSYKQQETTLDIGDVVLLMSDGYPELFNEQKEMLDYHRIKDIFQEVSEKSSDDIVQQLTRSGKEWSNRMPLEDDVTFVVVKMIDKL